MKLRKIFSIVINVIAVIASIIGFAIVSKALADTYSHIYVPYIKYFTLVTNGLICISGTLSVGYAIESLVKKDKDIDLPAGMYVLKLITAVSAMITFLTVVGFLQYTALKDVSLTNHPETFWNNIFHHYTAPLAFVIGFIFFDIDRRYSFKTTFFGIIALVVYMAYAIPFSNISACASWWLDPPYVFMSFSNVGWWFLLLVPGFIIAGYVLSILLWLLNRIMFLIFMGDEIKQDITSEEKEYESKVEVTQEDEAEVAKTITKGYRGPRIYHISKREDKMWQVKFATGKKAIKLFNTQAEAIVFAKKLAKSQEGSIRVHSVKGKIRKAR